MTIDGQNGITIQKGSISWGNISERPSIPSIPSYITRTKITKTTIESPTIIGGLIRAVGNPDGVFAEMDSGGFEVKAKNGGTCIGLYPTTTGTMVDENGEEGAVGCANDLLLYSAFGAVCVVDGMGNRHEVLHTGSAVHYVLA